MLKKTFFIFICFVVVVLILMRLLPCASVDLMILNDQERPVEIILIQASAVKLKVSSKNRVDQISLPTQIGGVGHFALSVFQNNEELATFQFGDYGEIDNLDSLYVVVKNTSEVHFFERFKKPKSNFFYFLKSFTQSMGCIGNDLFSTYEYRDHPRLEIVENK